MKDRWVSELDHCFVTKNLLESVEELHINQDVSLPSNHAPVTVKFNTKHWKVLNQTTLNFLNSRAKLLADYTPERESFSSGNYNKQYKWSVKTFI